MEEDWFLYSVTLFTFLSIFGLCYIFKKFTFFEKNKMLSASHPKFPFGNMHDVVFQNTPMFMQLWKFYNRFKKKKCKSGGFYVFLKPAILVVNSELTDVVLSQNNQYIQEWNHSKRSDFNDELGETILKAIHKNFFESWPSLTQSIITEEVNVTSIMNHYAMEIIARDFFCLNSRTENLRPILQSELEENVFSNFFKLINISFCDSFSPSCYKKYKKICMAVEEVLNERKTNDTIKDDVIQILFKNNYSTLKTVEILLNLATKLRISTNLILLLLYELSLNDEIQEDLRGEIKRFKKNKKITEFKDLSELNYLETVISETLRKYPAEPFVCKRCKKEYNQENLNFPQDVLLFVSVFGIHHDAQNYINPELFDPDRFAEENEKFVDSSKYLPFGTKEKSVFDSRYVTLTMKLILMDILSNFRVSLGKKSPKSLRFDEVSFRLKPKDQMWLKFDRL